MKKGLYVFIGNDLYNDSIGEHRKVLSQIKVFKDNGIDFSAYIIQNGEESIKNKILSRLPFSNCFPIWDYNDSFSNIDYIYFRRPPFYNFHMFKIIRKIKKNNPSVKIFMEIPTFPYDKELLHRNEFKCLNYPLYIKDYFWRKRLHTIINYIVTPANINKTLWGCSTIVISNGILLDDYKLREPVMDDTIDLLCVANFKEWHGLERLLKGLIQYDGDRKIKIHLVGAGTELEYYKSIVEMNGLQEHVIFYGRKTLTEMTEIYNISDIGICALGAYKKDIYISKELKSREYLAKGLPIISGCELDILHDGDYGYLLFPNNDSIIDVRNIVEFYDKLYSDNSCEEVAKKMRKIANENFAMEKCMKPVLDIMKNE